MGQQRNRNVLEVAGQELGRPPPAVARGQDRVSEWRCRLGLLLEPAL
jgi:hypothetical protein